SDICSTHTGKQMCPNSLTNMDILLLNGRGRLKFQLCYLKKYTELAGQTTMNPLRDPVRGDGYEEYIGRIGELVNGVVKRLERADIIVDLGKVEAILPRSQQSPAERYSKGQRVRAVINKVSKGSKPQVELSRTSPDLLRRLFEIEVPEIYDGRIV